MKNISINETKYLFVENFYKLLTLCDAMKGNTIAYRSLFLFMVIKELNVKLQIKQENLVQASLPLKYSKNSGTELKAVD